MGTYRTNFCITDRYIAGKSIEELAHDYNLTTEEISAIVSQYKIEIWHPEGGKLLRTFPIEQRVKAKQLVDRWNQSYSFYYGDMILSISDIEEITPTVPTQQQLSCSNAV